MIIHQLNATTSGNTNSNSKNRQTHDSILFKYNNFDTSFSLISTKFSNTNTFINIKSENSTIVIKGMEDSIHPINHMNQDIIASNGNSKITPSKPPEQLIGTDSNSSNLIIKNALSQITTSFANKLSFDILNPHNLDIYNIFSEKIKSINRHINISKTSNNLTTPYIIIDSQYFISNYTLYIINKISSFIIIAFFSMLILICSFYFIYKNIKEQYRFNEQREVFINNMSHELKTPVSTTKVVLESLINYNLLENSTKAQEYLHMAKWEIERLEGMIGKVMSTLKYNHSDFLLKKSPSDINLIINNVLEKFKLQLDDKKINLAVKLPKLSIIANIDNFHFTNALYNLIENAIKYGNNRIEITVSEHNDKIIIDIEDNGLGIKICDRQKIFEQFSRLQFHNNINNIQGYGLGLSYAKQIILKHNGVLSVHDSKWNGAKFTISLHKPQNI